MNPLWLARKEPWVLLQPLGHDKVPMFFWGPLSGPGVTKKKVWLLTVCYFSFNGLDPDGCLVADQLRVRIKTLEKPGAVTQKGHAPLWMLTLQKKS